MWTLDEHVQCAKDTSAWFNRVNFYIEQMHDCKFEPKRQKSDKFKPLTEEADQLYRRALFYKKNGRSSFDVFPSSFKCILEDCMFKEHEHDERCTVGVYYGPSANCGNLPSGLDPPEPLDAMPSVTEGDIAKIDKLNAGFVDFMTRCIDYVQQSGLTARPQFDKMVKYRDHVAACAAGA